MQLRKATRTKAKIRLGLSGVSGSGKTYSALLIAFGMCGDWTKIAVIDSENGSADLFAHMGDYQVLPIAPPFSPERYIDAIHACEKAGMEVIIIDSMTHEWDGAGGVMDEVDRLGGGFGAAWKSMSPRHEAFKQAILQSSCHMITTTRRKQEYIIVEDTNKNGKTVQKPVKAGMKEITREGWEYELTVNLVLDMSHVAAVSKDRTELFESKDGFVITVDTGRAIAEWCDLGTSPKEELDRALQGLINCNTVEDLSLLRETLPEYVINDQAFKKPAMVRYNELKPKKAA
jgi:hypothetical protein